MRLTTSPAFLATLAAVSSVLLTSGHAAAGVSPARPIFEIIARDDGFAAPDTMEAGMNHIVFRNLGSEIHEAMFVKLSPGTTSEDYLRAVRRGSLFPEGALDESGPGLTSPGQVVEMWMRVDAGNYVLICWYGDHTDTAPLHAFTVIAGNSGDATPPKEDAIVKLKDYRFVIEGRLESGPQVIRIQNAGPSMHEADLFRLKDGLRLADLRRWKKEGETGVAPAIAVGGILDSHDTAREVWLRKTLSPGRYVFWCNMPMSTNSSVTRIDLSHADCGMSREITVPMEGHD